MRIREKGKKGERGRGLSSSPATSCPDNLPVLMYMYPQVGLCDSCNLTAKNCLVFTLSDEEESWWRSHSLDTTFTSFLFSHMLLNAACGHYSRGNCLLDILLYILVCVCVCAWPKYFTKGEVIIFWKCRNQKELGVSSISWFYSFYPSSK